MKSGAFGPDWLAWRLGTLLPEFPDVALCVALSGGLDSVTLLAALAAFQRKGARKSGTPITHSAPHSVSRVHSERRSASRVGSRQVHPLETGSVAPHEATSAAPREAALAVRHEAASAAAHERASERGRRGRPRLQSLRAVHVHHGLHPNADKWSAHCTQIAAQLGVPLTVLRVKVVRPRGASLEAAARDARYEALANVLEPGEVLLTAHHEDDQLETVLLQLMRGAGIAGLAAMPEVSRFAQGMLVRPLLTRTRSDLEAWAHSESLTWVEDDTNADEQLDRNYLRRRVLPLIRARWPSAAPSVARTARHAAEAKRLLDTLALADVERASSGTSLSVQRLRLLSPDRRRNALRFWISRAGFALPDTRRLDEILGPLLGARPDANPQVEWNNTTLQRHADLLTLRRSSTPRALSKAPDRAALLANLRATTRAPIAKTTNAAARSNRPPTNARTPIARATNTATPFAIGMATSAAPPSATPTPIEATEWNWRAHPHLNLGGTLGTLSLTPDPHGPVDLDTIPHSLMIRARKGGERLRPSRNRPTRTLKALMQEARTSPAERQRLPLIYNGDQLIAAGDRWLDTSIQVTETTRHRARLRWRPAPLDTH